TRNCQNDCRCRRIKAAREKMTRKTLVLHTLGHLCGLSHVDGRVIGTARDHEIAISLGSVELSVRTKDKGAGLTVVLSRAGVGTSIANRGGEIGHGQITGHQRTWICRDPNRTFNAEHLYLAN